MSAIWFIDPLPGPVTSRHCGIAGSATPALSTYCRPAPASTVPWNVLTAISNTAIFPGAVIVTAGRMGKAPMGCSPNVVFATTLPTTSIIWLENSGIGVPQK